MVDGRQRKPQRPRERLRGREPDEERADEPRAPRDRDALEIGQLGSGLAERLPDHGRHELEVPPRRDLRHDPAVARMEVGLGGDDVRPDLAVVRDQRRRGLVTRRLEPEDQAL